MEYDLFDELKYSDIKHAIKYLDNEIEVKIEDIEYDRVLWTKTRFTFELDVKDGNHTYQKKFKVVKEYNNSSIYALMMMELERDDDDDEDDDDVDDDDDDDDVDDDDDDDKQLDKLYKFCMNVATEAEATNKFNKEKADEALKRMEDCVQVSKLSSSDDNLRLLARDGFDMTDFRKGWSMGWIR